METSKSTFALPVFCIAGSQKYFLNIPTHLPFPFQRKGRKTAIFSFFGEINKWKNIPLYPASELLTHTLLPSTGMFFA